MAALKRDLLAIATITVLALPGCHSIGPETVTNDRFDYNASIAESWKQQTLLNIIKLRYMDLPVFVDVASVVAGYSLQTGVDTRGTLSSSKAVQGNSISVGGQAVFTDRPTITYQPMTGERFLRGMMTPLEPRKIFFMLQSGYAADFVLGLTVESLNGVRNRSIAAGIMRDADPEFDRALKLLNEVQSVGAVGMRVQENKDKKATTVVFFRDEGVTPETVAKLTEIRKLLHLPQDQQPLNLAYSPVAGGPGELAVGSRSILQIMIAMSSYAQLPEEDVKQGRALPTLQPAGASSPVTIHCSKDKPKDAFASVPYRDQWFWIDDKDWRTKRALTAIMFLFTMTETASDDKLPLITIPAQ